MLRTATASADLGYADLPQPLTGGFWAELFAFSLAAPPPGWPGELVIRLMPDPALARKETIVQAAVAAAGYPTPVVRASGGPDSGLGRAPAAVSLSRPGSFSPGDSPPSLRARAIISRPFRCLACCVPWLRKR